MSTDAPAQQKSRVALTVAKDGMSASVLVRGNIEEDPPVTAEEIHAELESGGVVFGIDHDAIQRAVEDTAFNTPITVAQGRPPERGVNTQFTYHFDTSATRRPKQADDGLIDYKDINFIQNCDQGQLLATKTLPVPGTPGMNVRGKEIKATDGKDIPFGVGQNTEVSEDGLSLTASRAGAIQFSGGKISVLDVITISGDVDHTIGNIECKGSVRVGGHIKAGYKLQIEGDLEVNGNVEDTEIRVDGNIMIKGGFFGEGGGVMIAGGDIDIKYAEGQRITAGNEIRIGGEIINCQIEAGTKVMVLGNRGKIVGGSVKAQKEIRAAILGSDAATITLLQVAYDPELLRQHREVIAEIERLKSDEERVKEALYVLYREQMDSKLTPARATALEKLEALRKDLPDNLAALDAQREKIEEALKEYASAEIICEDTLYPGVKASFGIVYLDVLDEYRECRLHMSDNHVMVSSLTPRTGE